jgi:tetratricopeptide (TPR) repeat protein
MKRQQILEWVAVAAVVTLALVLRLVYVFQVKDTSLVAPEDLDPGFYYQWAKEIAGGNWLGKEPFVQSPLYAYLLGLWIAIAGPAVGPILVVQGIAGALTVFLTYVAGRRFLGHGHGLLAALLVALYAPFLFFEGMVMKSWLSPLLTILLVLVLDAARASNAAAPDADAATAGSAVAPARSLRLFGFAGALYGLATLDRDNFILLAPVMALLALWLAGGWSRRGLRAAGAFTLGTVLLIVPVTLRNWAVSGEFVLLTTGGGEVFFIGNNEDANGLYVPPPFVRPDPKYEHADFVARASEIAGGDLTPMQSSWFWFREGMKFIAGEPLRWLGLQWWKTIHFWNFFELPDNLDYQILQEFSPLLGALNATVPPPRWPTLSLPIGDGRWAAVRLHLFSTFGTLAPLGLLGIWMTRREWRRLVLLYVLLFGYMATVLLFFNFGRFRVPVVPILALFAAAPLHRFCLWLRDGLRLLVGMAARAGDLPARARTLLPGRSAGVAVAVLLPPLLWINLERPRGVVPALEQALTAGNAYYAQQEWDKALQRYMLGLILLGEVPGEAGEQLIARFGPEVTREALLKELETEAVARGPQFKGMHLGIHHGIGIALLQSASARLDKGDRAGGMNQLDQAIAQFQEALRIAPAYLLSHRKMARAHALKGDPAEAIEWLTKAAELWPEDLPTRFELSEQLFHQREFAAALRQMDEARQYNKGVAGRDLAQIYFYRGLIYQRGLDQPGKALYDYERALATDPGLPQADDLRREVLALRARGIQPLSDEAALTPPAGGGR